MDRLYECEVCQERLTDKKQLLDHLQQHIDSGEKQYPCRLCPKSFVLPRQLKEHQRNHLNKNFRCDSCPKKFRTESALQEHFNSHTGNRPYGCDQCNKSFTSKHVLKTHAKTHGVRIRPHKCTTCDKSFLTVYHLYEHAKVHEKKKGYVCEVCGKCFNTQRSLDLHGFMHSGIKNYACKLCNKKFARKNEVEDHERTHTGERPFQCEICGATFCQRSNLQSHKKATHLEEKNYRCTQCPKAFKRRRLLIYHSMSVHTGERPYKCEHCNSSFVYPEHHRKHLRIHTGEKPFKCDICGKAFNSRDNRNAHKFIHSDKKPYECLFCGQGFMRKPMIISHLHQQHNRSQNHNSYIKVNPPSSIEGDSDTVANNNSSSVAEVATSDSSSTALHTIKLDEDQSLETSLDNQTVQFVQDGITTDVDVTRPVHIVEDFPRYIIHTASGDRNEENISHFLASLQGQVVEVRTEDLERYAELTTEQVSQIVSDRRTEESNGASSLQQVTVSSDLRPFQLQLQPNDREISLQTHNGQVLREVTATIISTSSEESTPTSHFQTTNSLIGANRQLQFESSNSNTWRKLLTERDTLIQPNETEGKSNKTWHQQTDSDFIGS